MQFLIDKYKQIDGKKEPGIVETSITIPSTGETRFYRTTNRYLGIAASGR